MKTEMNLPTIDGLRSDEEFSKKQDQLNFLLNQEPPAEWVKKNKYANNSLYLPIERIEFLLKRIFKDYKIEVREVKEMFNGVATTVRLHYKNPINGEWYFHDGVGAGEIQTKSGASPADMAKINKNAIQMCVPISRSEALKNAAKTFGRIFGSDLNRKQKQDYSTMIPMDENHPNWDAMFEAVKNGTYTADQINDSRDLSDADYQKLLSAEPKKISK